MVHCVTARLPMQLQLLSPVRILFFYCLNLSKCAPHSALVCIGMTARPSWRCGVHNCVLSSVLDLAGGIEVLLARKGRVLLFLQCSAACL